MAERRAKKSLGQNFLIDEGVSERIVQGAGIRRGETVVEIGPGKGALTRLLLERADRVVCVEKDDTLAPALKARFAADKRLAVLHTDALTVHPRDFPWPGPYRVVANLPYNVAGRITMDILEGWGEDVVSMTLMFQREVAQRLAAGAGDSSYGAVSALVGSFAEVWRLFGVPPGAFRPAPKVRSEVVRLRRREQPLHAAAGVDYSWFRTVVRAGFATRRKVLTNSLALAPDLPSDPAVLRAALAQAGLDGEARAETVGVDGWVALAAALESR